MRRFVILVAVCLLAGVFAPVALANGLPPGGTFTDDDLNTHEGNIEAIASVGVTKGCNPAGPLYCPADLVTRGQMASFLARAFNLPATGIDYFSDDGGTTHEGNINRIREAAITTGFPDGTYRPDGFVTRAQMGSFIARAMGLKPIEGDRFADVSGTHAANINAIADAGVTLGCNPAGTLYCPDDFVRRDQMASFIARALRLSPIVPPALVSFGDGIWRVDADIPPGTYRNKDSSGLCYGARLSGFGGTLSEIIANELSYNIMIVTIEASDTGFESVDCRVWSNKLTPRTATPTSPFGAGYYLVGTEVAAGLWRNSDSSGLCYWERLSGFGWTLGDIITNGLSDSIQTVQIGPSDVGFHSEDCGTWTYLGP